MEGLTNKGFVILIITNMNYYYVWKLCILSPSPQSSGFTLCQMAHPLPQNRFALSVLVLSVPKPPSEFNQLLEFCLPPPSPTYTVPPLPHLVLWVLFQPFQYKHFHSTCNTIPAMVDIVRVAFKDHPLPSHWSEGPTGGGVLGYQIPCPCGKIYISAKPSRG